MTRLLCAFAVVVASAPVVSAQYPYNYGNGYAVPTVPQLPGTYMLGPNGSIVGGGYGATVFLPNGPYGGGMVSYNPYWGQMQAAQRQAGQQTYQRYFGQQNQYRGYRGYRRP